MATVRRWTGREARALRAALRYSVRGFAEYLGVGVRTVATCFSQKLASNTSRPAAAGPGEASGDRIVPRPVMQSTLDTALSRADADAKARFAELLEVGFSRRDLPILLAAIGQPFRHGTRLDRQLLVSHLEASEHLASLYRAADPREALPSASAYADALLDLYWRLGETDAFQLAHVVVGVHAQIGLWACHADLPVPAHRYLATACEVAEGTQDRPLLARAFAALSYLYSSAPRGGEGGQPRHALRLLDQAAELSAGADAFTKGWVAGDERTPKCRQPCASGPRLCQGEGAGRRCGFGGVAQIGESGVGERIRDGSAALPWRAGGF